MTIKYAELFAGIGGLGAGFKREGAKCVFANEYDKYAAMTYTANNDVAVDVRNVRDVQPDDLPDHDVLLAGFPCQPFSVAGISKRQALGRATGMECQDQGNLFFEVARLIAGKKPKAVVLENVKNLVTHNKGCTFKIITSTLQNLGYTIDFRVLDATFWVPQHRERIFVVAIRGDKKCDLNNVYVPDEKPTLQSILHCSDGKELPEKPYTSGKQQIYVSPKYVLSSHLWAYLQDYKKKHQAKGNGFGFSLVNQSNRARTLSARYYKDGSEILIKRNKGNPRRLTPRECSRLMGFDRGRSSDFRIPVSDNQAYKQFGNAVVPPVAQAVAKIVLPCL